MAQGSFDIAVRNTKVLLLHTYIFFIKFMLVIANFILTTGICINIILNRIWYLIEYDIQYITSTVLVIPNLNANQ